MELLLGSIVAVIAWPLNSVLVLVNVLNSVSMIMFKVCMRRMQTWHQYA